MRKIVVMALCFFLVGSVMFAAGTEEIKEFPNKTISVIVPFGAGGGTDALARKLADVVQKQTGYSIIIENKTGGSGAVGMSEGAIAKPDGYTVTMTTVEVVLLPAAKLANFQATDFKGIIRVNFDAASIIVKKDNPANTLEELVANSKTAKKATSVNVSAFPTNYWLCGALLKEQSGGNFNLVEEPNGAAQEIANLLGGHVDVIICTLAEAAQYVENGDFKFIATASSERNSKYPNVPTFIENGYDIEVGTWRGFMVPKATEASVVAKLEKIFTDAYDSQEFKDFLNKMGFGDGFLNSSNFDKLIKAQVTKYGPVISKFL